MKKANDNLLIGIIILAIIFLGVILHFMQIKALECLNMPYIYGAKETSELFNASVNCYCHVNDGTGTSIIFSYP